MEGGNYEHYNLGDGDTGDAGSDYQDIQVLFGDFLPGLERERQGGAVTDQTCQHSEQQPESSPQQVENGGEHSSPFKHSQIPWYLAYDKYANTKIVNDRTQSTLRANTKYK